jgi:hypothetical protein
MQTKKNGMVTIYLLRPDAASRIAMKGICISVVMTIPQVVLVW